jgi:methylmalonyl-CoA/ethylmalonyl-CoA epimerase
MNCFYSSVNKRGSIFFAYPETYGQRFDIRLNKLSLARYSWMRVDHIAIAVNNVNEALKDYQKILNVNQLKIEEVPNEKVRVAMLMLEDTRIELMEPTAPDSPISKFLQERGEGIHHIAITADNIEKDVERASVNGMRMLGGLRTGSYGRKITFVHPKSLHGVLTEFCEAPQLIPENGNEE